MTIRTELRSANPRQLERIPNFFIIGHAKCGTTALWEMLRRHPQIYMPHEKGFASKEPWFFSRENPNPQLTGERSVRFTGRHEMTLEEYLTLFVEARAGQIVGEASTSYIWSTTAATRIAEARPDAKIIALLREPASYLRSMHMQLVVNHAESELDFRTALSLDEARREGRDIPHKSYWPQALIYSDRVRYVEQLERYHAVFPPEQVLVLIYDDFRDDNPATVRRVLRFLGADDTHAIEVLQANPSSTLRSARIDELSRSLRAGNTPLARAVRDAGKGLTTRRMREALFYPLQRRVLYRKPLPVDHQLMNELRHRFKPEVERLSEYLDRNFVKLWGYDHLE